MLSCCAAAIFCTQLDPRSSSIGRQALELTGCKHGLLGMRTWKEDGDMVVIGAVHKAFPPTALVQALHRLTCHTGNAFQGENQKLVGSLPHSQHSVKSNACLRYLHSPAPIWGSLDGFTAGQWRPATSAPQQRSDNGFWLSLFGSGRSFFAETVYSTCGPPSSSSSYVGDTKLLILCQAEQQTPKVQGRRAWCVSIGPAGLCPYLCDFHSPLAPSLLQHLGLPPAGWEVCWIPLHLRFVAGSLSTPWCLLVPSAQKLHYV